MLSESLRAYFAGCFDCDGSITIIARGDGIRHEAWTALNQVTPQIPRLLAEHFGGNIFYAKLEPPRRNRYMWRGTCRVAEGVCRNILPYLTTKRHQAELILELRESKTPKYKTLAYWYQEEHPNWRDEEAYTYREVAQQLKYKHIENVKQSVKRGMLLAAPGKPGQAISRVPQDMVAWVLELRQQNSNTIKIPSVPPQLLQWRKRLREQVQKLNHRGC